MFLRQLQERLYLHLRRVKVEDAVLYYEPPWGGEWSLKGQGENIPEENTSRTEWTRAETQHKEKFRGMKQVDCSTYSFPLEIGTSLLLHQRNSVFGDPLCTSHRLAIHAR